MVGPHALELHCRSYGELAQRPLVLIHGLFGSSANWGSVARRLASRYRVLVPDLRNHGQSPHASVHDYPAMAADLVALLDRHAVRSAILVGHSMGGKVAMHLALTAPQRVAALAVVDIAPVRYAHDFATVMAGFDAVDLARLTAREQADAQMRSAVPGKNLRSFLLQNLVRAGGSWRWRLNLPALAGAQTAITGFPDYPPGTTYEGPTSFIHGEMSDYVKLSHRPRIRALFPNAMLSAVAGAGHWVYAEQPDAFLACLDGFLDRAG